MLSMMTLSIYKWWNVSNKRLWFSQLCYIVRSAAICSSIRLRGHGEHRKTGFSSVFVCLISILDSISRILSFFFFKHLLTDGCSRHRIIGRSRTWVGEIWTSIRAITACCCCSAWGRRTLTQNERYKIINSFSVSASSWSSGCLICWWIQPIRYIRYKHLQKKTEWIDSLTGLFFPLEHDEVQPTFVSFSPTLLFYDPL